MYAASVLEKQFSWTHSAWDPTEPIATRPLFTQRGTGYKFFYTFDGNKNVSELVHFETRNGIAAHYDYAPFGAVTRAISASAVTDNTFTTDNPFRFSSEYHDDTFGLVYYNYRHYNPTDGRWCGRDLLDESLLNTYIFLDNVFNDIDLLGARGIRGRSHRRRKKQSRAPKKASTHPRTNSNGLRIRGKCPNIECRTDRPNLTFSQRPNGCGSSWNIYLVPDRDYLSFLIFENVDFTGACNRHDSCYATCNENKVECDDNLLTDMQNICDSVLSWWTPIAKSRCYALARTYWFAVTNAGGEPYEEAQDAACEWEPCCKEK